MTLSVLPGPYGICRLSPEAPVPAWATGAVCSVTRTADELSVLCEASAIPPGVPHSPGWRALKVHGPLDLRLTGVLASLAVPLADARISLFAVSTYDTDYVFVPGDDLPAARTALEAAGHILVLELPHPPEDAAA